MEGYTPMAFSEEVLSIRNQLPAYTAHQLGSKSCVFQGDLPSFNLDLSEEGSLVY